VLEFFESSVHSPYGSQLVKAVKNPLEKYHPQKKIPLSIIPDPALNGFLNRDFLRIFKIKDLS
jgi:hypothetical protein